MANDRGTYGTPKNGALRVQAVALAVQERGGRYVGVVLRRGPGPSEPPIWSTFATTWREPIDAWFRDQVAAPGYEYVVAFDRAKPLWTDEGHAIAETPASSHAVSGRSLVGADVYYVQQKSSWGTWIIGGLVVGGAVLWAKHQSDQIDKLYATAGLPRESFADSLRQRSRELSSAAGDKIQALTQRLRAKKET